MSALLMGDKIFYLAIHSLLHVHSRNSTSVHSNSGTHVFCAKVSKVIFETIDKRGAPHCVGFGIYIHLDMDVAVDTTVDLIVDLFATKQRKIVT
jgi:hypothetical protein